MNYNIGDRVEFAVCGDFDNVVQSLHDTGTIVNFDSNNHPIIVWDSGDTPSVPKLECIRPLMQDQNAWETFQEERRKKIGATAEEIFNNLINDGFSNSASTRSAALYRALEIVPECKDEEIFKAGYRAGLKVAKLAFDTQ